MPARFTSTQIALHWLTALLILAQFLNDGAISRAFRATMRGAAEIPTSWLVPVHVFVGIAILVFTVWRVVLRLSRGAPPPPAEEPRALQIAAAATHGTLYLLLLLLPLTGFVAWFGGVGAAGGAHEILKTLLLVVIGLHVDGALYHRLILKSGVMERMLPARGR